MARLNCQTVRPCFRNQALLLLQSVAPVFMFFEVFTDKIISEQCFILLILSYHSFIMNGIQGYAIPDHVPGSCHMATE